ncbi:error-prone DNA polymerase, DnaE-like [Rhizobiales bacterium GAS113]|nr:error-prone DNA polymerase, DnaE-like [Rhizobiales bacterium GAS113]
MTAYAELAVTSNFSFLRGASHPQEMVAAADALGLAAIGIADRNSFAGVVRAYAETKRRQSEAAEAQKDAATMRPPIKLLVGTRLVTTDGFEAIAYPIDRPAYGRLCRLLTAGNLEAKKGECLFGFEAILAASEGQMLIALPPDEPADEPGQVFQERLALLARRAKGRVFLAGVHRHRGDEPRRLRRLAELGSKLGAPLVAVNDVHYHAAGRRPLADIVTCIREKCSIADAGLRLTINAERYLKPPAEMARLFAGFEEAIARSVEIAERCSFSLDELKYEYPDEPVPPGKTAQQHLEDLTWEGAGRRYPKNKFPLGLPEDVRKALGEELVLIAKLQFARYFLTVHDVVAFARGEGILCQGRGSAANSAVCYCLGITEVDPTTTKLLFARFISEKRGEPPDIDVDFEHDRREEVIQHIYKRYGRHRAAICATVIHYRSRRAIREVGKVLGLTPDVTAALAKTVWGSNDEGIAGEHIRQIGLDPGNPAIRQAVELAGALIGFPRHLSQHVGGFVLTREALDETVPIGNAAMEDRTFIEWDKDDIDVIGLMKVDVLALGMLSCLRRGLDLLKTHYGQNDISLACVRPGDARDDPKVYEMLSRADSVGVFQVESRAQMSMLPRLKPRRFYDLVIEVAIVRPGPIQGDMVHPYLRRRDGIDRTHYPSPDPRYGDADELKEVLQRTLGVPLFQEQAMQIAITAAKFSPSEADGLRRAMATFRHNGTVHLYREKFISGMTRRGYERQFAESCFNQIEGFGEYGFPESHAASFALLVYVSAWLKCHYPEVFCAAILNSQPMGFYQPAQLVRDACRHGVEVRQADVNYSAWDCTLEAASDPTQRPFAVRLGFRQILGLREEEIVGLVAARGNGYASIERLAAIGSVSRFTIERLAEADAFRSLGLDRRDALWAARRLDAIGIERARAGVKAATAAEISLPLFAAHMGDELFEEARIALPAMPLNEHVVEDYVATGLSLKAHPVSFLREKLARLGALPNAVHRGEELPPNMRQDMRITVAGLVLMRQMPGTAKGVVFMTLEDETDIANIIVWPKVFARNRITVMTARLLAVRGRLQRVGIVVHVIAEEFVDLTEDLRCLPDSGSATPRSDDMRPRGPSLSLLKSRDFH